MVSEFEVWMATVSPVLMLEALDDSPESSTLVSELMVKVCSFSVRGFLMVMLVSEIAVTWPKLPIMRPPGAPLKPPSPFPLLFLWLKEPLWLFGMRPSLALENTEPSPKPITSITSPLSRGKSQSLSLKIETFLVV